MAIELYPWISVLEKVFHLLKLQKSTFMGWIYGILVLRPYSGLWLTSCLYSAEFYSFSWVHHLFIFSLWSDIVPSFTLMPKHSSLLLKCLASAGLSLQESPQSSSTGCAKLAEGRRENSGSLRLSLLSIFSKFPDKETDVGCKEHRSHKNLCICVRSNTLKQQLFITALANACEHLEDGETVSGTKIEGQRDEET